MATCSSRCVVTGADGGTSRVVRSLAGVRLDEFDYELPAARIAQVPIEPRDAARLLVDRGSAPPEHRTVADLPDLLRRRRRRRRQRDQGDPGPAAAAPGDRRRGRGAAARAARARTGARGRRSCARPASCATARSCSTADGRPVLVDRRPHGGRRHVPRRAARRPATRSTSSTSSARCRCRRTSTRRLDRPDRYQTVYADEPGSAAAPTAGLHLTPSCSTRIGGRRRADRARSSSSSASTRSSRSPRTTRSSTACTASATACRRRRGRRAGGADGSSPSARRACGRWRAPRRPGGWRGAPSCSSTAASTFAGRRRAADQLPPAPHDAADDDRRLRRAPLARRSTTTALADGYRFLSFGDAMLLDRARPVAFRGLAPGRRCELEATDGAARAGVAHDGARHVPHAVLHAGRHPRRGQVPQRRRLRGARRRDRARQHVPPDAAARAPTSSPASAASARSAAGTASRSPTPAASRCSRSSRRSTTTASRSAASTTARRTASRRSRRSPPRSCSAPTSRWCSTCARRCRARPTVVELAVERTAAWAARARAAHRRDGQALFGIVQGGIDEALRAESARAHRRRSTSTATASAGCRWGRRGPRCCRRWPRRIAHLPADRPRYLMGVGDPASLVEAVAARRRPVRLRACRPASAATAPRSPATGTAARQGRPPRRRGRAARRRLRAARCAPATAGATSATCSPSASRPRRGCVSLPQRGLDAAADGPDAGRDRRRHASTRCAPRSLAVWG